MSKTLLTSPAAAKIAPNFIERHGLFDAKQRNAAEESRKMVKDNGIETIRLVFPDQYGLLRGKALTVPAYFGALSSGNAITMAPFFFDTADAIATFEDVEFRSLRESTGSQEHPRQSEV